MDYHRFIKQFLKSYTVSFSDRYYRTRNFTIRRYNYLEASSVDANIVNLDNPIVSDIQDTIIYMTAPDVFPIGETIVTWTAIDASNNSAITTQTVTIVDTTKPGLSIPGDQTVEASSLDETH